MIAQQSTLSGHHIADVAKTFLRIHGEAYGRARNDREGLDCVGLVERVAEGIGIPLSIDRDWHMTGGDLPLRKIPAYDARTGDVLAFDFCQAKAGSSLRHQLGIITSGRAYDTEAQIICVPHAVGIVWLAGLWRTHLVQAYRFEVREHV